MVIIFEVNSAVAFALFLFDRFWTSECNFKYFYIHPQVQTLAIKLRPALNGLMEVQVVSPEGLTCSVSIDVKGVYLWSTFVD